MITQEIFGLMPDGREVIRYSLTNSNGVSLDVLSLGAIIQRWRLGNDTDIVLGFDDLDGYLQDGSYLGTTIGRYANRIGQGKFSLNGEQHNLSINLAGNTLHGGRDGFDKRLWRVSVIREQDSPAIELSIISKDGDQGFPGTLHMRVIFTLTEDNCLRIDYHAESDKDTVFNPTQHSYFNLAGQEKGPVVNHQLQVFADHFTPADETGVPTGEIADVEGSDFDLRSLQSIGDLLDRKDPRLKVTNGLDHNWCLNVKSCSDLPHLVANVIDPQSGRQMQVKTTMPGMQVYTANFIEQGMNGKNGAQYGPYHAFCLETQFYPDAPNKPHFPQATLKKGETFHSVTEYQLTL